MGQGQVGDTTMQETIEIGRRTVMQSLGSLAVGAGGMALYSRRGSAESVEIEMGELQISDATHESENPEVVPVVDLDCEWSYRVEDRPDNVAVELRIADEPERLATIASETTRTTNRDAAGSETFTVPITESSRFDDSDFAPEPEETVQREIVIELACVVTSDDIVLAEDSVQTRPTVEVANTAEAVTVSVGGTGEIRFEDE